MSRVSLHHVAERAGVSIKTVSRVINDEPNVRPATREAVLEAVRALGYRPDSSARRLAGKRSYLIGLLYEDPTLYASPSATYVTLLQGGVLERTREEGYDLLIHPCDYRSDTLVEDIAALVGQQRLDGLVIVPPLAERSNLIDKLRELHTPFVRISPGAGQRADDTVQTNDREICADMTRYLASLGHRRIGFIVGHPDHRAVQNRFLGYRDGLESCGIAFDEALVQQGFNSFESGEKCARILLMKARRPTAIFASNDDMACGVLRVAHDMGLRIPQELSVAGFDDVPLARQVWPSLTTVRQPTFEMASAAAALLFARVRGREVGRIPRTVSGDLVVRDSTGPAPETSGSRARARPASA